MSVSTHNHSSFFSAWDQCDTYLQCIHPTVPACDALSLETPLVARQGTMLILQRMEVDIGVQAQHWEDYRFSTHICIQDI